MLIYQKLFGSHSNPDRGLAVIRTSLCDSTRSPRQHRALFVRCSLYITRWEYSTTCSWCFVYLWRCLLFVVVVVVPGTYTFKCQGMCYVRTYACTYVVMDLMLDVRIDINLDGSSAPVFPVVYCRWILCAGLPGGLLLIIVVAPDRMRFTPPGVRILPALVRF